MSFLVGNKIASVGCCSDNVPYCFNCFYAVLESENLLIFKSSEKSRHMNMLSLNGRVAGTVVPAQLDVMKVEGVQFEGCLHTGDYLNFKAAKAYYLRYPFAIAIPGSITVIELTSLKYTITNNGIKRKTQWQKEPLA